MEQTTSHEDDEGKITQLASQGPKLAEGEITATKNCLKTKLRGKGNANPRLETTVAEEDRRLP